MNHGIVGNEAAKFTLRTERLAREVIRGILHDPLSTLVSGHCHLGGVDIYAEEEAQKLGREMIIHAPEKRQWQPNGYKERNLRIVEDSHTVHNIVVAELPVDFRGRRHPYCYHCYIFGPPATDGHVKSGGCWTALKAMDRGRKAIWYTIFESGAVDIFNAQTGDTDTVWPLATEIAK